MLHKSGRFLLYHERMYFNIIAFGFHGNYYRKGRLHDLVKVVGLNVGLNLCVYLLVRVCVCVCDFNLTTIIDGIMHNDL